MFVDRSEKSIRGEEIVPVGTLPPPGRLPKRMHAQVIRPERYGEPAQAFRREEVEIPSLEEDEVLVAVMAAGINFNNVWAARGYPLDVVRFRELRGEEHGGAGFHIGGSEASGIVYAVGEKAMGVSPGDRVVIQGGVWDRNDPGILEGGDPVASSGFRSWGYETNWGSFAQFSVVKDYQCLPKPESLTWEEAAVYILSGATAYRMLHHWAPHNIKKGDAVLIWGASGGLGVMAIQLVREAGGIPVAVVGSEEKRSFCESLGAEGVVLRNDFHHWGALKSGMTGTPEEERWRKEARAFQKEIQKIAGGEGPAIVLEHPGEKTLPTSLFVCSRSGMVVTCGGTTGYAGSFDLRYLWIFQKRIQGSHFADLNECREVNRLVEEGRIRPVLSKTFSFDEIPMVHQMMWENRHPPGNMAVLVGSPAPGLGVGSGEGP